MNDDPEQILEDMLTSVSDPSVLSAVRRFQNDPEPLARAVEIGEKVRKGGRRGNRKTYGSDEEKRQRWKALRDYRAAGHSVKETAVHFRVSTRTVERRTQK